MTTTDRETIIAEARARKASALTQWCRTHGVNAETVAENVAVRDRAVRETGVRTPSLSTWMQVVAALHALEAAAAISDPFAGL